MAKRKIIAGLDIGSSAIKLLVASKNNGSPEIEILFRGQKPSLGMRRGVVVDVDKVSKIIRSLVDKARAETGEKINSVFVNIGGSHISSSLSRGMIAVSRADRNISKEDVERVLQEAAKAASLSSNREILETSPKEFIIDGVRGIKEAEGLQGNRLETEILVLSNFSPYKNNLIQSVLGAELQILDIIPSAIAASYVVLSQKQKELGAAVLEIGEGTSDFAVFQEGDLIYLSVLPIGSANITSDIAIGLKIDIEIAEAIKLKLGSCLFKGKDKKQKIEIEGEDSFVFSQKTLNRIIEARVSEIFGEIQKELKKISQQNILPAGIFLTGGGAKLPKIIDFAKKEIKLPCRLGKITHFSEMEEDMEYATVCGLVLKGFDFDDFNGWRPDNALSIGFFAKAKKILKNFLP